MAYTPFSIQDSNNKYTWSVLDVDQYTSQDWSGDLTDRNGNSISFDASDSVEFNVKVSLSDTDIALNKAGSLAGDTVTLSFDQDDIDYPGIFYAEFVKKTSEVPVTRVKCYLNVETGIVDNSAISYDPVTIADIRSHIRDRSASDNEILAQTEFESGEICAAALSAVNLYNQQHPFSGMQTISQINFPNKEMLMVGTLSFLLRNAYLGLVRNRQPINSGGLQVDDKSRADVYTQLAEGYRQEYLNWISAYKASLNRANFIGVSRSKDF